MPEDTFIAIYESQYVGLSVACVTNNFVEVLASGFVNAQGAWRYATDAALGLAIQEVVDFTERRLSETVIKKSLIPKDLSPQFAQKGKRLPMSTQTPAHARRCERKPKTMPLSLVVKGGFVKCDDSASSADISLSGASVRTKLTLVPGQWVGVVPKGEFPHAIPTRVVWVREDEYSHWTFAGLEFLDTLET